MLRGSVLCAALCLANLCHAGVREARYTEPTTRYDHGILGDAIEYGAISLTTDAGKARTLRLPETRVFEDLAPRLIDLDGDGDTEIVAIETSLQRGARLAIYDEDGFVAATPFIGRTHRWLAPLGAADLDGDGEIELAYIDRPHLAKTLRIWRFSDGKLSHVADHTGLTNHRIGQNFISGGIRSCDAAPEIITVNADWSRIMATTLAGTKTASRDIGQYTGPASLKAALTCP